MYFLEVCVVFFSRAHTAFTKNVEVKHTIYLDWPKENPLLRPVKRNNIWLLLGSDHYLRVPGGGAGEISDFCALKSCPVWRWRAKIVPPQSPCTQILPPSIYLHSNFCPPPWFHRPPGIRKKWLLPYELPVRGGSRIFSGGWPTSVKNVGNLAPVVGPQLSPSSSVNSPAANSIMCHCSWVYRVR